MAQIKTTTKDGVVFIGASECTNEEKEQWEIENKLIEE